MKEPTTDFIFMKMALKLAEQAGKKGEVPVGAVITQEKKVIACAFNQKETLTKATAHAEILAIEQASSKLGSWRLNNCTIYVTLEPCPMCAGALVAARLKRLVYGCKDPKSGAVHSLYQIPQDLRLNHQIEIHPGLLAEESAKLLKEFFHKKRKTPSCPI
ncbi:MAG: tRNA adenosine(34) deaminase TadA [Bdellovibrionales bacterium]|nr:tRNA adenosine(34) deaminase TadA [Bdellovibrionales bacterium]